MQAVNSKRSNPKPQQTSNTAIRQSDSKQKNVNMDKKQNKNQKEELHLPAIKEKQPRKEYGPNEIPASYTVHREKPTPREHENEDLSTVTKMAIIEKNRNLIYRETQLTKMKVEKLKALGTLDNDIYLKLKKSKEEKRWDILMKYMNDHPKNAQSVWEFMRVEYPNVHSVLQDEYISNIRLHFQPRLSNLKSTPGNLLKMSDILLEITEEYDVKVRDLDKSVADKQRELDTVDKTLRKIKALLYAWGQREMDESEAGKASQIAQEIVDAFNDISVQKDTEIQQKQDLSIELELKINKLSKNIKDKDKKLKSLTDELQSTQERVATVEGNEDVVDSNELDNEETQE